MLGVELTEAFHLLCNIGFEVLDLHKPLFELLSELLKFRVSFELIVREAEALKRFLQIVNLFIQEIFVIFLTLNNLFKVKTFGSLCRNCFGYELVISRERLMIN